MLSKKILNQLKDFFTAQPVDVVYLYGSQATGKATKISDTDVAVIFKKGLSESKRFDLRLKYISKVCGVVKTNNVDVIDLEKAPIALQYSAIAPKKEIINKNNNRRVLFEAETNSRYFDYIHCIKQNTLYSLASIARMN